MGLPSGFQNVSRDSLDGGRRQRHAGDRTSEARGANPTDRDRLPADAFLTQDVCIHNPARAENPPLLPYRLRAGDHKVVESAGVRIDAPTPEMALERRITTRTGQT